MEFATGESRPDARDSLARRTGRDAEVVRLEGELRAARAALSRARAEVAAARGRTVDVLESMGDAFLSFDEDWRFTYINGAAAEALQRLGKDPDTLLGQVVWDGLPEIVGTGFETEPRRAAREGEVVEYEEYFPALDAWLGARVYPSKGGVSTYIRDVTEQRNAREALRRNEERWRALIDKGADVLTISDRDGTIRFASPSIETVCGYRVEEFVGKNPFEEGHIHPDDVERCEEAFRQLADDPGHSVTIQHRYRHPSGGWRWLEGTFTNFFDDPAISGLVANFRDITERKRAEEKLRRAAEFDAFRVALADALRPLTGPAEIQAEAMRVLGEHLRVDRVLYAEIEADDETVVISDNYVNGVPKITGRLRVSDFGWSSARLRAGETLVISDLSTDKDLAEPDRASFEAFGIVSSIGVPLVKGGRWVANLGVHHGAARAWSEEDIAFLEEAAERAWAAVERARTEEALRESEEKYRTLFDSMDEGFFLAEVIFDEDDRPVDICYLDANPAATRMTGQHYKGRRLTEIDPGFETHWFETFGRVARTGEGERMELYTEPLQTWFNFYVFKPRHGDHADGRRVAVVFEDVTERKRTEEALRESEERLRTFMAGAPVVVFALDREGTFVLSAGRGLSALGLEQNEVVGRSVFDVYADMPEIHEDVRRALGGEVFTAIRKVSELTFETRYSPLRGPKGETTGVIGVATDVTERKRIEEERDRLLAQEWAARAQVAERERISRELHDRVAHSMAVVHQNLQLYEVLAGSDPSRAVPKLETAKEMARAALDSTRNLSAELRRSDAEENLEEALRALLKVSVPSKVQAELSVEGDESLVPGRARGQLFLILREAVRNAISHAGCRRMTVALRIDGSKVVGRVEDDGRGFDPDDGDFSGVGLSSMQERTLLLGGELSVRSAPGSGTKVEVSVPLGGRG